MIKVRYQTYLIDKDNKLLFPEDNKELATYLCNHIKDIVHYVHQDWYDEYVQYEDYDDEVFYTLEYYGDGEYCIVTPFGFSDCYFYIKIDNSGADLAGIGGWVYLGKLNNNTYVYIN